MEIKSELHTKSNRNYLFDNLKAIGIMLVVFGHLIEQINSPVSDVVYKLIYLFHMPLFIVVSGYFASFDFKKIISKILVPYLILQILFIIEELILIKPHLDFLYFLQPKWILWYLFALVVWKLSIIIIQKLKNLLPLVLVFTIVIGLGFGFVNFDGYILSLSRIVVLYPFFIFGYYCRYVDILNKKLASSKITKIVCVCLSLTCAVLLFVLFQNTSREALYGALNYYQLDNYGIVFRAFNYIASFVIVFTLMINVKREKSFISNRGRQSFMIYIGHAPLVTIIAMIIAEIPDVWGLILSVPLTIIIIQLIMYLKELYDSKMKNRNKLNKTID